MLEGYDSCQILVSHTAAGSLRDGFTSQRSLCIQRGACSASVHLCIFRLHHVIRGPARPRSPVHSMVHKPRTSVTVTRVAQLQRRAVVACKCNGSTVATYRVAITWLFNLLALQLYNHHAIVYLLEGTEAGAPSNDKPNLPRCRPTAGLARAICSSRAGRPRSRERGLDRARGPRAAPRGPGLWASGG